MAYTKTCRLEPRVHGTAERVAEHFGTTIGTAIRMLILNAEVRRQFLTPEELNDTAARQQFPAPARIGISSSFPSGSARVATSFPSRNQGGGLSLRIQR